MSRWESAIRLVIEFNEAFNRHDVAGMMQLMSEDCLFETTDPAPDGSVYSGKAAVTRYWQVFFHDSPHAHIEIEEIFTLGCAVLCAGDMNGWILREIRDISGVSIYTG